MAEQERTIYVCPTCGEWDREPEFWRTEESAEPPGHMNESCGYGNHEYAVPVQVVPVSRLNVAVAEARRLESALRQIESVTHDVARAVLASLNSRSVEDTERT